MATLVRSGPHPLAAHLAALWASSTQCSMAAASLPETGALWHPTLRPRIDALARSAGDVSPARFAEAVQHRLIERLDAVHRGLRAYQAHPYQRQLADPPAIASAGSARLLDYGGSGPPVVFIPSLINPAWVLDLAEGQSLLRWLATQGLHVLLVDWGAPGPVESDFRLDDYAARHIPALASALGEPVRLAGYCLGGTLALAAACLRPELVRGLALIAAPWDFAGYPMEARQGLAGLWSSWAATATAIGALPMEALQLAFAALDPTLMERKFARFADLPQDSADARQFVALEDWANSGPPLVTGAAAQAFERLYGANESGQGLWRVDGAPISPQALRCPVMTLISQQDRLVPRAAAQPLADALPDAACRIIAAGHVGMITGSRARAQVWQPLRDWLLNT